jgi:hypothetical protein
MRPAKGHRQKGLLLANLPIHINALEKVADAVIAQNLPVENVYRGVNGGLSAQLFVQGTHSSSPEI